MLWKWKHYIWLQLCVTWSTEAWMLMVELIEKLLGRDAKDQETERKRLCGISAAFRSSPQRKRHYQQPLISQNLTCRPQFYFLARHSYCVATGSPTGVISSYLSTEPEFQSNETSTSSHFIHPFQVEMLRIKSRTLCMLSMFVLVLGCGLPLQ